MTPFLAAALLSLTLLALPGDPSSGLSLVVRAIPFVLVAVDHGLHLRQHPATPRLLAGTLLGGAAMVLAPLGTDLALTGALLLGVSHALYLSVFLERSRPIDPFVGIPAAGLAAALYLAFGDDAGYYELALALFLTLLALTAWRATATLPDTGPRGLGMALGGNLFLAGDALGLFYLFRDGLPLAIVVGVQALAHLLVASGRLPRLGRPPAP